VLRNHDYTTPAAHCTSPVVLLTLQGSILENFPKPKASETSTPVKPLLVSQSDDLVHGGDLDAAEMRKTQLLSSGGVGQPFMQITTRALRSASKTLDKKDSVTSLDSSVYRQNGHHRLSRRKIGGNIRTKQDR
jgi:hypothetical protein